MDDIKEKFYQNKWEDPVLLKSGEYQGQHYGSRRGVAIVTIEGALGLDFTAVVLAGLYNLGAHDKVETENDLKNSKQDSYQKKMEAFKKNVNTLYTGCTRAKDELIIILPKPPEKNMFLDLLRDSKEKK
jgi:superfamily I DNA/RNA helicase